LREIKRIFTREFAGLYYDDEADTFYSTKTERRTRTYAPIAWTCIKYSYTTMQNEKINRIYRYLNISLGNKKYYRLSELEWNDWQSVDETKYYSGKINDSDEISPIAKGNF
jgi:hypothetical protein